MIEDDVVCKNHSDIHFITEHAFTNNPLKYLHIHFATEPTFTNNPLEYLHNQS